VLFVDIHELALHNEHYTMLSLRGRDSWELEKPVNALPPSIGPVELLTQLAPFNATSREFPLLIYMRYAEP
ncbi:hypothetical protein BKA70DRAFT_1038325, partial [Coprinopsis sp. MPI-PUGE-AT-0042]